MSIKTMTRGDTVFINAMTQSNTDAFSNKGRSWAADSGTGVACRVETLSASEVQKYRAQGMSLSHRVYFSADQSLSVNDHRLHWTKTNGNRDTISKYLRVKGAYIENNPRGRLKLYVVDCDQETERRDG